MTTILRITCIHCGEDAEVEQSFIINGSGIMCAICALPPLRVLAKKAQASFEAATKARDVCARIAAQRTDNEIAAALLRQQVNRLPVTKGKKK